MNSFLAARHTPGLASLLLGTAIALLLEAFLWSRRKRPPANRPTLIKVYYFAGVVPAALGGLLTMPIPFALSPTAFIGFTLEPLVWLFTGWLGLRAMRVQDALAQRRWMARNVALTLAPLCLAGYVLMARFADMRFELACPLIAWLFWLPNLLLVEAGLRWQARKAAAAAAASAPPPPPAPAFIAPVLYRPPEEQIEALLYNNAYDWAVSVGAIVDGEPLIRARVFNVRQSDALRYLETHPVPGIDSRIGEYSGRGEGPNFEVSGDSYAIGWSERGNFSVEHRVHGAAAFRQQWIKFLVASMGLPE
jgi:hypothetical protein